MVRLRSASAWRRIAGVLGFFVVAHYVLLPQIAGVEKSLDLLRNLDPLLVIAAVAAEMGSLGAYAQLARSLMATDHRPEFGVVLRVQTAMLGLSHVVPGGAASAAPMGYRLLQRAGLAGPEASFVLGGQSIVSAVMLDVILLATLVISIPLRGGDAHVGVAAVGSIVTASIAIVLFALTHGSTRTDRWIRAVARALPRVEEAVVIAFLRELVDRFRALVSDRRRLTRALGWASVQWIADATSLWLFLAALGVEARPETVLVAFGLANVSASIPFTPGGVGVYEAVITSSLVGFGVPHAEAIIGVLAYRLFEFWLPIPLGAAAYLSLRSVVAAGSDR